MNTFYCSICKYETTHKGAFKRHCNTNRHHEKEKNHITNSQNHITNSQNHITNSQNHIMNSQNHITKCDNSECNYYKCDYCNVFFKRIDNYTKHLTKCCKRLLSKIQEKDKIIKDNENTINQLKEEYQEDINTLQDELNNSLKEIQELKLKVKDTEINYLKKSNMINSNNNSNNTSNNNITQFIINNYPNAPNIEVPDKIENMDNYIYRDTDIGVSKLINNLYCKDKKPEERSIWCVDLSRNKYLMRMDNLWQVDLNGVKFCSNILCPLGNKYVSYMNKKQESENKMSQLDLIDCLNIILKLKDLNKINKPIRSYLTFNKPMITVE